MWGGLCDIVPGEGVAAPSFSCWPSCALCRSWQIALGSVDGAGDVGVVDALNWSVATVVLSVTRADKEVGVVDVDVEIGASET